MRFETDILDFIEEVDERRRWSVAGANAIIALRCAVESNRFDDFWERRASPQS